MSQSSPTFVELCRTGRACSCQVDDFVDAWHRGGSLLELHEFLGLTREQYAAFVADPSSLTDVLHPGPIRFGEPREIFPPLADFLEAIFDGTYDLGDVPGLTDPFPPAERNASTEAFLRRPVS